MDYAEKLVGLDLRSVSLGRGVTSLQLDGKINGEHHLYICSTGFEMCFDKESVFKDDIIDHPSTLKLWDCLEKSLIDISISDDGRVCSLKLEEGPTIYVWSESEDHDNLFVVRRWRSDEWFTIG
jgi:hypothetical protein